MKQIDFGEWKGIVLYAQDRPFTKRELKHWKEHYKTKFGVYKTKGKPTQYVLGISPLTIRKLRKVI